MEGTTKRCSGCGIVKPVDEFYFRNRARSERQPFCRSCKSRYNRAWYQRNRERHQRNVRRNRIRYIARLREIVGEAKKGPCADCGRTYPPECMDFDHLEGTDKRYEISRLVRIGRSIPEMLRELEKCELVCSNCHRIRTTRRRREAAAARSRRGSGGHGDPSADGPVQLALPDVG